MDSNIENSQQNDGTIPGRNGGTLRPFRPGESGNPNGVKKGTKHLSTILRALLAENMSVTVNGQTYTITRAEALMLEKVRLATNSPFDAVRLRAIMDIEDRLEGRATRAVPLPPDNSEDVVVFYIPDKHNRKRLAQPEQ